MEQGNAAVPGPETGWRLTRAAVLVAGFLCGATALLDMDFHWHLALGQRLVAHGFPDSEPLSHLPVGRPDRQAWLADAAFAVLDRIGGVAAIRIAFGLAFAAGCLSVLRLARRRTSSIALALVPLAVYVAFAMARLRVRPDLLTLVLLPLFAEMLDRRPSWSRTIPILVVSALWANLHPGSLIAGLLALAQLWPPSRLRIANAVATWAGLCLTPDGVVGLLRYTADTTPLRPLIPEWQRIWERPFAEFAPEWAVIAGLAVVCVAAGAQRVSERSEDRRPRAPGEKSEASRARVGVLGPAGGPQPAMQVGVGARVRAEQAPPGPERSRSDALRALLGLALAASALRFLFALVLPALWAVSVLDRVTVRRAQLRAACLLAAAAAFVFFPLAHLRDVTTGLRAAGWSYLGSDSPSFPSEAAAYLASSGLTGNLAHPAGWGGYLGFKLAPRFKTATDGRVTHFGPDLAREWWEGINSPAREEIFARRGIDLVVIPRPMLPKFRDDEPYQPIYGDSFAIVLFRLGGPHDAENRAVLLEETKQRMQKALKTPR